MTKDVQFSVVLAENGFVVRAFKRNGNDVGERAADIRGPFIATDFAGVAEFVTAVLASEQLSEDQRDEKRKDNKANLQAFLRASTIAATPTTGAELPKYNDRPVRGDKTGF